MNKELLNTPIVKSAIKRYISDGLTLKEINLKLLDIQLIIITEDELQEFIKNNIK